MNKRKKIIKKSFQSKLAFRIVCISMIFFLLIVTAVMINAYVRNARIQGTIGQIKTAIQGENDIIEGFLIYSSKIKNSQYSLDSIQIGKDHRENMERIKSCIGILESLLEKNIILFSIIFAAVALHGITLYYFIIRFTHRISGPAYLLSKNIRQILQNEEPDLRPLRKNDELKELYADFTELVALLNKKKK